MAGSNNLRAWFITLVVLSYFVSVAVSQTGSYSRCTDGTYQTEDGTTCCMCGAGTYVKEHCTQTNQRGQCEPCPSETYSSHPNSEKNCEPCKSCAQSNANLEESEPCTPGRNRKCRCKEGHYCDGPADTCTLCQPCEVCGPERSVQAECTPTSNTVCTEKKGGNNGALIAGIIVSVIVLAVAGVAAVYFFKKRRKEPSRPTEVQVSCLKPLVSLIVCLLCAVYRNTATSQEEVPLLTVPVPDVAIQTLLPEIGTAMGWKVMKDVATRSGIPSTIIDSCRLNYPNDAEQQTEELLAIFVERHSMKAPKMLVHTLQNTHRQDTAEKVVKILSEARANLPV